MAVWNPKKRNVAPVLCAALAAAGLIFPYSMLPAYAQQAAATPAVAPNSPNAQILILVTPVGTTAISSVYPGQVAKTAAQARIDRLIKLTGWKAKNRKFSDAPAPSNRIEDDTNKKLSAASFETDATVLSSDGKVDWEPFLRAFGDVKRVNILCLTQTPYTGPTQYDTDRLALTVYAQQGSILAAANIKSTGKDQAPFGVPKVATAKTVQEKRAAVSNNTSGRRTVALALAVTIAVVFAFVIYKWTSNYAVRR